MTSKRVASDFRPDKLLDSRSSVPFKGLLDPFMVPAGAASFLDEGEYVLGVTINGVSRAYPTRYAFFHQAINDHIGQMSFAVTYCAVCNTGICFDRVLGGRTLSLDFYGLYLGVTALLDRETGSVWGQISGEALTGELAGKRLRKLALLDTTWATWKHLHPDTEVMAPHPAFSSFYWRKGEGQPRWYDDFPEPYVAPTVQSYDSRLLPFEPVYGVYLNPAREKRAGNIRRAYPLRAVRQAGGVVNDTLNGVPVAIFMTLRSGTVNGVSRVLDGRTFTFRAERQKDGRTAFKDNQTGTRWNIEGLGLEGPLAGRRLVRLTAHLSQWYGWSGYFPNTSVYNG